MIYELPGHQHFPADRDMIGKFLIFIAAMTAIGNANSALLCEVNPVTLPDTCDSYNMAFDLDFNKVFSCRGGGSSVTEFEVYGGCGPNAGSGSWSSPVVQTPSGVHLTTNAAGLYCYCQIKSINGANVASSPRWLFGTAETYVHTCSRYCSHDCAYNSHGWNHSIFRAALFQALQ